ncbi:MAG: hypothetical protein NC124_19655 [Clostridium sp.]|nr:hypothetical protein [Clostridium sp.]
MTQEKMTVHKALAELKIVDDRIISAINGGTYCVANKHSNEKIKGVPVEEYKGVIQGYYDKATDLIKRRNAIKRAVVLSNATTKVTINGLEYTVAEAIEMKNHGVEFDEKMLDVLNKQYNKAQSEILKQNGDDLEKRAEQYVIGIYGSKEGKTNTDDFEKTKKDFITANSYELIDPIKILDKINALEESIASFKAEVDAALSVSNSITEIVVEY